MTPLTLALCVQNCPAGAFTQNLEASLEFISRSASAGADLIVFPEMNLTGYVAGSVIPDIARPIDEKLIQSLSALSNQKKIIILAGMVERNKRGQIFASHLAVIPDHPVGIYRKIHRAPNEQACFSEGHRIKVFSGPGFKFGIQLCYDAHFPELSTAMALAGADIVFLPHASPRGTARGKFDSWMRHLSARAFDNGMFIVAVNQVGDNGAGLKFPGIALVIGPDGKPLSIFLDNREHLYMVDLDPACLDRVRSHRMRYFLPNRRADLFPISK